MVFPSSTIQSQSIDVAKRTMKIGKKIVICDKERSTKVNDNFKLLHARVKRVERW